MPKRKVYLCKLWHSIIKAQLWFDQLILPVKEIKNFKDELEQLRKSNMKITKEKDELQNEKDHLNKQMDTFVTCSICEEKFESRKSSEII